MQYLVYSKAGRSGVAVVVASGAVDVRDIDAQLPCELDDIIAGGAALSARIGSLAANYKGAVMPLVSLTPRFPLSRPGNIICVGLNYAGHAKEGGHEIPTYPGLFMRTPESMAAAEQAIVRPRESEKFDYEAELMIVVGKGGRRIKEADALEHVFGYTCFNDMSLRDYQRKGAQWLPGKNFDGTGPVGPVVVTADELPKGAHGLRITSRINGTTLQDSNTADLIFSVARCIAIISEFATLKPGDLIATGTPEGVGYPRKPPVFMKAGDTVEVEIDKIGILRNTIIDEA
ncbi:MAG: fumarylacetoacetate hydrolase family protein [Hyphomicrobiaceae bacterium]|nr:fumarylacetoacetate hydrolase family protein [Hyphomicrobiaceae bacterium]